MSRPAPPRRPRGIAAVEMALILPTFALLLALPLFFGRALYHYQVMQRASHDAARYLASCAEVDLKSPTRSAEVVAAARAIVVAELDGGGAGRAAPLVSISCNGGQCSGYFVPTTVTVQVTDLLEDDVLPFYSYNLLGASGLPLSATATMRYVGN